MGWAALVLLLLAAGGLASYTRQWAVQVRGPLLQADLLAKKHGFINLGQIFEDVYHFQHNGVAKRSTSASQEHHERLLSEEQVLWAKQQKARSRKKRDYLQSRPRAYPFKHEAGVRLNDPRWPQMWYLNRGQGLDMNVQPAWTQGVTGKGVVVTILDDGLEKDHPDLYQNYDPQASYDVNGGDEDPMPRYDLLDSNRHGTRCAGEVAATANNSLCAVGVAFGASVGGVRMLDGDVTDAVEARSLSLNPQHIDIYSASWGPDDDGKTVDGPGELATRAFMEGVTRGRSGKGSIFVWASGNGGRDHDNCNCDGYTNSIWTLSISSATENGLVPWYSEACSSTLATTYSSGSSGQKQVVTTDLHHQCTSSHTGTSASAPLAAGICALALQANQELTWRDMQHIVVRTAKPHNLKSPDWQINGIGRNVSHSFGYGLMDASGMVKLARTWKRVPEQQKCEVSAPHTDKLIPAKSQVILQLHVKECAGVNFLEHVQAKITLVSSRRGDLQIHLTSPTGTRSTLLARRPHDMSRAGFQSWPFMSVHTWGEQPFGIWELEIHNEGRILGTLYKWNLVLHGTDTSPDGERGASRPETGVEGREKVGTKPPPSPPVDSVEHNSMLKPEWKVVQQGHARNDVQRTTTEEESSASSGCVALSRNGQECIECVDGLYLLEGHCVHACPEGSYQRSKLPVCIRCHYSCLACVGPNDYHCSACHGDAQLYWETGQESYCYPLSLLPHLSRTRWTYWAAVAFSITAVLLLVLTIYVTVSRLGCPRPQAPQSPRYRSVKVNNTGYDVSGSDSEG